MTLNQLTYYLRNRTRIYKYAIQCGMTTGSRRISARIYIYLRFNTIQHGKFYGIPPKSESTASYRPWWTLPTHFSQLCHLFHNMIDLLIANSVFPTSLNITYDTPIHKDGPCDNPNDYTPVLILPVLSNIIKHHVAKSPLANLQEATWSTKHSLVSVLITSRGRPLSAHWYRVARFF